MVQALFLVLPVIVGMNAALVFFGVSESSQRSCADTSIACNSVVNSAPDHVRGVGGKDESRWANKKEAEAGDWGDNTEATGLGMAANTVDTTQGVGNARTTLNADGNIVFPTLRRLISACVWVPGRLTLCVGQEVI
jgi:hypothetical protein